MTAAMSVGRVMVRRSISAMAGLSGENRILMRKLGLSEFLGGVGAHDS
jgi:hypothetical protein